MKKPTTPLAILLFLAVALCGVCEETHACESYEECISLVQYKDNDGVTSNLAEFTTLKAIAYKLDEISNKLDNLSPHDPFKSQFTKGTVIEKGQCPIFGLEHCWQNQSHTFSGPQSRVCLNCGLLEVKKTEWVVNKSLMQSTKKKNTSA